MSAASDSDMNKEREIQSNTNKEHHFLFSIWFDLKTSLSLSPAYICLDLCVERNGLRQLAGLAVLGLGCLKTQSSSGSPGHKVW